MKRTLYPALLKLIGRFTAVFLVVSLASLIIILLWRGLPTLNASLFFGDVPAWKAVFGSTPVWEGIWPACTGTLMLVLLTVALAVFPGIGCGIYLAEYAGPTQRRLLGCAVDMLAGVPSIVMGLFGFTLILFLRKTFMPEANTCLLLAAVCLALLVLPSLVLTTREALEGVPQDMRFTCAALGFSREQRIRHVLLPLAGRGILGGVILSLGRAAEDTAVIMLTGVVANAGLFNGIFDKFQALPFTIFYTAAQYQTQDELARGFGAALVLLVPAALLLLSAQFIEYTCKKRWEKGTT